MWLLLFMSLMYEGGIVTHSEKLKTEADCRTAGIALHDMHTEMKVGVAGINRARWVCLKIE